MTVAFDQLMVEFALPTPKGFLIYELATGMLLHEGHFPGGGANCLSILSDSNIIAASGDNSRDGFSDKSVVLWDRSANKVVGLFEVKNVITKLTLRRDVIIVAHGDCVSFHNCFDFHEILCVKNPIANMFSYAVVNSNSICLAAFASTDRKSISIVDYHEPEYILGTIPIPASKIAYISFDRHGKYMVVVLDDGKIIQLWSVLELSLVASYRRGISSCEVSSVAFDSLSSYFTLTTKKGTMYVFAIPNPSERASLDPKSNNRQQLSYSLPKNLGFKCEFDLAGYAISCVSPGGNFKRVVLDIDHGNAVTIAEKTLDM